ncbi:hypothetical protein JCM19236_3342 [Vibrio sp. JCM 19236]|nr:hypothetical protein JCM19236_3342 [Vibrio sp. JCM 19236]
MKLKLLSALVATSVSAISFSTSAATNISVNVKDDSASVQFVDYNDMYKIAFGGADNVRLVSQEFFELFRQDSLKKHTIPVILEAVLFDKGWSKEHGVEGVTLKGLTDTSFTLAFKNANTGIEDAVVFYGSDVTALLDGGMGGIVSSNINIKDNKTRLAVFNPTKDKSSIWIGGGKSDSVKRVSQQFADITGGSKIQGYEVKPLLEALLFPKKGHAGIEGVTLLGLNKNSFLVAINEGEGRYERILFKGDYVADVIAKVTGSETGSSSMLDTGDGQSKFAIWNTDERNSIFISGGNPALKGMFGHKLELHKNGNELKTLVNKVMSKDGIDGVTVVGLSSDSITLKIKAKGSTMDTLMITGNDVAMALSGTPS